MAKKLQFRIYCQELKKKSTDNENITKSAWKIIIMVCFFTWEWVLFTTGKFSKFILTEKGKQFNNSSLSWNYSLFSQSLSERLQKLVWRSISTEGRWQGDVIARFLPCVIIEFGRRWVWGQWLVLWWNILKLILRLPIRTPAKLSGAA